MNVKLKAEGETTTLALAGDIDENLKAPLGAALANVKTSHVVVDCGGVRRINSMGVRDWIQVFRALPKEIRKVELTNCPVSFMDMVVMVPPFAAFAQITAFFVAFCCDHCRQQANVRAVVVKGRHDIPSTVVCERCGHAMVTDGDQKAEIEALLKAAG